MTTTLEQVLADRALLVVAQQGDSLAVHVLVEAVRASVLRYCRGRLSTYGGGVEAAEDVTQEVCLAVVAALPRYQDRGVPFAALVYAIASNKVADAQRRFARTPIHVVEELPERAEPGPGPEQEAMDRDDLTAVLALLEKLPPVAAQAIRLRMEGRSAEEVGRLLGMSANAVRVSQHRGLARLRELVAASPEQQERFAERTSTSSAA